jgi:hypothetical protein
MEGERQRLQRRHRGCAAWKVIANYAPNDVARTGVAPLRSAISCRASFRHAIEAERPGPTGSLHECAATGVRGVPKFAQNQSVSLTTKGRRRRSESC